MRLLDPKNDYVFKRLFAVAPHLLTALINAVRSEDEPQQRQQACWCFEMRDRWQPATKLGPELELNIIELGKADRLHRPAAHNLVAWIAFFRPVRLTQ